MKGTLIVMVLAAGTQAAAAVDMNKLLQLDTELLQCFDQQAARLDDGRSDARSVAAAVNAACGPAKMKVMAIMNFSSADAVAKAVQASRDQDIDRATIAVLKARVATKPR